MGFNQLGRREFITLLGGVAAWPLAARAQQPTMQVIGFLHGGAQAPNAHVLIAFRNGLSESGFVEGQNVAIEFHWAEGRYDRLSAMALDFVHRQVAVIVAGGIPAALAAKAATTTIPIVFTAGIDPVEIGLVASLNRPGGNLTGVNSYGGEVTAKGLGVMRDLVPSAAIIAILVNPKNQTAELITKQVQTAARAIGQQIRFLNASSERDVESAFATLVQQRVGALVVGNDVFFNSSVGQIAALAARHAIPTLYSRREFAAAGGLVSYGPGLDDAYRQNGIYAGRILKGEKPSDLPVVLPTKFDLVINLKTAKALGLDVPAKLLALADEVID
jgi:putative ABC transport system substrate-binding protein